MIQIRTIVNTIDVEMTDEDIEEETEVTTITTLASIQIGEIVNLSTPETGITTGIIRTKIPGHRISISRMVNKTSKTLKLWKHSKTVISR